MKTKLLSRTAWLGCGLFSAWLALSFLVTIRSYSYSDQATYNDVQIATDEGLIFFRVPLARLAPGYDASTNWTTYTRQAGSDGSSDRWVASSTRGTKFRIREYLDMLSRSRGHTDTMSIGRFHGFAYAWFDASWTPPSRPGPVLWILAPIWAILAICATAVGIPLFFRVTYGIRSILLLTAVVATVLLLPTLHGQT